MSDERHSVVLADDHRMFRDAIAAELESDPKLHIVASCADGDEALAAMRLHRPRLAVLDVSMPKRSGVSVARAAEKESLGCAIVLLTMHRELALHSAPVAAVVLKEDAIDQLRDAIDAALRGERVLNPRLQAASEGATLTIRQGEVLRMIAQGLSSPQIATALGISRRTVESHRASIAARLGAGSIADLVRHAIRLGLVEL